MTPLASTLLETIDGLSRLDAVRLEANSAAIEALVAAEPVAERPTAEVRALQHTLRELLHSTDANLRLLRELRELQCRRKLDDTGLISSGKHSGDRWVR